MTENISVFLNELKSRGIEIVPNDEKLHVDAPVGLLTGEDRERLIAHKKEILLHLQKEVVSHPVQVGEVIRWVSPVVGPAGPATILARSGQWVLVSKPSHEVAAPNCA